MNWIDTHAHLYAKEFDADREKIVEKAFESGVEKICLPNIDLNSIEGMFEMQKKWQGKIFPMIGLHPCSVKSDFENQLEALFSILEKEFENGNQSDVIAVGETGLDYYWDKTFVDAQKSALNIQIDWAKKFNIPIILHCRDAFEDLIEQIEAAQDGTLKGIFHCFTGTEAEAERVIRAGFLLGIGGVITFKNSKLATELQNINPEHIVLETDSPYLAPAPYRGKRNESSFIPLIGEKLSSATEKKTADIAEITTQNAKRLFKL